MNSTGLYAEGANVVISGAVVNATGGATGSYSYGGCFYMAILTVESGSLTATGGRTTNHGSCGIFFLAQSLVVRGGTLTAIGGEGASNSCGIWGYRSVFSTISVSGGMLVAEGGNAAIADAALSAADGMEVRAGASKTDAVAVEGDGWREKNYVEVGPPPAVTLSPPGGLATFSEGSTGPALGRIDVGLTTLPTADITVHLDVRRVGASTDNYPLPELSSYYIEFGSGSPRSQSVYFEWLDGTSAGASDGYLLTAFVTNATPGPSGVPWKDLYAPGAMTNYVANEAPRITSFAPTDASPVVAGVPFTISYSLKDVPADFSAGLTLAWTTSEGFTTSYQVSATSVSNYATYASTSPPFTFSSPGPHSASLVVEDKDRGTSEEAVFDVTVLPPPEPPAVSNVVARQRWPWNGLVDVDYEVGGDTNLLANLAARITFAASDGRSWTATNFLAGAEPSVKPGPHRATWDTVADGVTNVVAANVVATVCLERSYYTGLYLVTEDYTVSDDGTQILDRYEDPVDPANLPTRQTIEFGAERTFKVIGAVPDAASPGSVLYSIVEDAEPVLATDADTIANAGFRVSVARTASAGDTATIQAVRHGVKSGVMTIAAVPFESIFVCNGEWVLSDDGSKLYDSNYPDDPNDWDFVGFIFDDFLVGVNFGIGAFNNTDVSFQLIAVDTVQEKLVRIDVKDNPGDEDAKVLLSGDHPESGTLNLAGSCVHVNADATSGALVFVSARYRGLESDPNSFTITVH